MSPAAKGMVGCMQRKINIEIDYLSLLWSNSHYRRGATNSHYWMGIYTQVSGS